MKIRIINGKRLTENFKWVDSHAIDIENGQITALDKDAESVDEVIDAQGCLIFPGLTDINVSLREPGYTAKGSVMTETKAAVAGGVTRLCCSPETGPVNDSRAVTKLIKELAHSANNCEVLPLGALTKGLLGEQLAEYAALKSAGCIALSNAYHPIKSLAVTKRCFEYAKTHELSVFINPIEASLHQGSVHEGHVSTTIGLQGISPLAETIAVAQLIQLAAVTGVHLHLSQLSVADSVAQVRKAKDQGINITADVAIQNLLYTDQTVESFASTFHCFPPFREESDRLALIKGVAEGVIDAITSAHQPHEAAAKQMPFAETEPGMSTIEFLLPMAQILASRNELSLECFLKAMTKGAADILKRNVDVLERGKAANIVIYSADTKHHVTQDTIISKGKNVPLLGQTIQGKTKVCLYKGSVVFRD